MLQRILLFAMCCLLAACTQSTPTLFEKVLPKHSQVLFNNAIVESEEFNILTEEYIYNGGGVGVGDFDKDGRPDLFFTGNQVPNELYLNRGNFRFEAIGAKAGILAADSWCSGVAVVDINQDGWDDLYITVTMDKDPEKRKNLLFVNNGLGADRIPTFTEAAANYGLDDTGNSIHSVFFDYDKDGDLDLYILTNVIDTKVPSNFRVKITDGSALNNDRLYHNNGDGTFTNVSKEAGIRYEGFGLGVAITDVNFDGWPDIYVTNDYISNDLLYINNQDGTFTNRIAEYITHQSHSAMGNDVVDLNNDGMVDILVLDMLPETNERKKKMIGGNSYVKYVNNRQYNYEFQYVRNTLQLHYGLSPEGKPVFGEIGQYANLYQTDWSWTPLVVDFDNDGFRDVVITNGFPKDVTDRDFALYVAGPAGKIASNMFLQDSIPIVQIPNYAFRNRGDLTFEDVTTDWGMGGPSFSNGAVFVDLDGDGDQDVVINNINGPATIYRNQLRDKKSVEASYLQVAFEGNVPNRGGFGTSLAIYYQGKQQFYEHSPSRGYLSSVAPIAHFGLGNLQQIDSLVVQWPDGSVQRMAQVPANQLLTLYQRDAQATNAFTPPFKRPFGGEALFQAAGHQLGIDHCHHQEDIVDFSFQRTLPHKYSQMGPGLAVGDVNGDGLEDFVVGAAAGHVPALFLQKTDGTFQQMDAQTQFLPAKAMETMGLLLFDADGDGDLDLYMASGGYHYPENSPVYQDQLYRNDGKGSFVHDPAALPAQLNSTAAVKAADFDGDGDLDLFVAGRVKPIGYPMPVSSFVYQNEGGVFKDVTAEVCPALADFGMVTDALWTDFDGDGMADLILTGEWMPITFLKNTGSKLVDVTQQTGLAEHYGWWNSIATGDFDQDGDMDYVVGNLGLNSPYRASSAYPLEIFGKDFDGSGSIDPLLSMYYKSESGEMKSFPMASLDDMIAQMQIVRRQFPRYGLYAKATLNDVVGPALREGAFYGKATSFISAHLENLGDGKFAMHPLPREFQFAPMFGFLVQDMNQDGFPDLMAVGNHFGTEVFTGKYAASVGWYAEGDGKGGFKVKLPGESGFFIRGDARALANIVLADGSRAILATQNSDSLRVMRVQKVQSSPKQIPPLVAYALLTFADGRTQKVEFPYGSTYLSQSSRVLIPPPGVVSIRLYGFNGELQQEEAL